MTQEEKKLLMKDICSRLPYGIIVHRKSDNRDLSFMYSDPIENMDHFVHCFDTQSELDDMELYLRPMSSMTNTEKKDVSFYRSFNPHGTEIGDAYVCEHDMPEYVEYLLEHQLDYRGLIEKGLAVEAPQGMYDF